MKYSNLAECFEEFAVTVEALEPGEQKPAVVLSFAPEAPLPAPRRSAFGTRRIEIRDEGLRPFRVS